MKQKFSMGLCFALVLSAVTAEAQRSVPGQTPSRPLSVLETKLRADAGNIPAQVALGAKLAASRRFAEALVWYRKAAAAGSADGAYHVGNLLLFGANRGEADQVVKPVPAEGVRWTFRAATNLHAGACRNMSLALQRGLGVRTNLAEAYAWMQLYAERQPQLGRPELDDLALRLDLAVLANARKVAAQFKSRRWPRLDVVDTVVIVQKPLLPLRLEGVTLAGDNSLAVVNRRTLAAGETTRLPVGKDFVEIKCLEIRADSVLVEVAGEGQPRWVTFGELAGSGAR